VLVDKKRFNSAIRRSPRILSLSILLGVAVASLTQCRMITDNLAGVKAGSFETSTRENSECRDRCHRRFESCVRTEGKRHRSALEGCDALSGDQERQDCRQLENGRHRAALQECRREKEQCRRECRYHEGGGDAGR
jgi:hypothetical protein